MLKNKKIIIIAIALISLSLFGSFFYFSSKTSEISLPKNQTNSAGISHGVKTILEINNVRYEEEIADKISVYNFMSKLRSKGKIDFTEKNYISMGKFVTSISGIENNGEKNWIYYVNGVEAQVGVSNYKINPGDIISWKYEK